MQPTLLFNLMESKHLKTQYTKLLVNGDMGSYVINVIDILKVDAAEGNSLIILKNKTNFLLSKTLKYCESILPPNLFLRVHKSHIINLTEVYFVGSKFIQLNNGEKIPINKNSRKIIINKFHLC